MMHRIKAIAAALVLAGNAAAVSHTQFWNAYSSFYAPATSGGETPPVTYYYTTNAIWIQGLAGTKSWTDTNNWNSYLLPSNSATTVVYIRSSSAMTNTGDQTISSDPATLTLNKLIINGSGGADGFITNALTIGTAGNQWTFTGTTPQITLNSTNVGSGAYGITLRPDIVNPTAILVNGTGTASNGLTIAGNISGSGSFTDSLNTTYLVISGSNSFSGGITRSSGDMYLNSDWATGPGPLALGNNGSFGNSSGHTITNRWNNQFNLGSIGTLNFIGPYDYYATGSVFYLPGTSSKAFAISAGTTISCGGLLGASSGTTIQKSGSGTLALYGTNFIGLINLYAGTLALGNSAAAVWTNFAWASATLDNVSGASITLPMASAITMTGSGTFGGTAPIRASTNVIFSASRTITFSAGDFYFDGGLLPTAPNFVLTVSGNGNVHFAGTNTLAKFTLNSSTGARYINSNWAAPTNVACAGCTIGTEVSSISNSANPYLSISGNTTFAPLDTLDWGTGTLLISTATRTFTVPSGLVIFRGPVTASAAAVGMSKAGAGAMEIDGVCTYTASSALSAGTLCGTGTIPARIPVSGGAILQGGKFSDGGTLTLTNVITFASGATNRFILTTSSNYGSITHTTGIYSLTNATLALGGTYSGSAGDVLTIISESGTIAGGYTNAPTSGVSVLTNGTPWNVTGWNWLVKYAQGGGGKDVTITAQTP